MNFSSKTNKINIIDKLDMGRLQPNNNKLNFSKKNEEKINLFDKCDMKNLKLPPKVDPMTKYSNPKIKT